MKHSSMLFSQYEYIEVKANLPIRSYEILNRLDLMCGEAVCDQLAHLALATMSVRNSIRSFTGVPALVLAVDFARFRSRAAYTDNVPCG